MKPKTLKNTLLLSFLSVIFILGSFTAILGFYLIQDQIVARIQKEVIDKSNSLSLLYEGEINNIAQSLELTSAISDFTVVKKVAKLDYVYEVSSEETSNSNIVRAAFKGKSIGGTRIIREGELKKIFPKSYSDYITAIEYTPKASPTSKKTLNSVIALEYAQPVISQNGEVLTVRYGGRILNGDFKFVDKVNDIIFARTQYKGKPIGTVTIFQDDVRVTTNVLNNEGKRAVGTRVSEEVYQEVLQRGESWINRAFVVTDWYLTAYRPIKNVEGKIIGILYVGMLEKPLVDLRWHIFLILFLVISGTAFGSAVLSYFIAHHIAKPVTNMASAAEKISQGDFSYKVLKQGKVSEIISLTTVFNSMAERIQEREKSLQTSNGKLEKLNKSYLDLVGFVSHELKGILSSIVLNVYNLNKNLLGPLNEAQQKALNSISRNLNYLSETVKNFLNLSRIEKEEFEIKRSSIFLKKDVFDEACEYFIRQAEEKNMQIENNIDPELTIEADLSLIQIAVNNILSNAVKYGRTGGKIIISCKSETEVIECKIYNDAMPIEAADIDKLFKKFSRLNYQGLDKVKGTGIGLFITKEIITRHGGSIWVEPQATGNTFCFTFKRS
ncbi:MAG: cache domain-containing protein [Candidatus Omnitrophica bacterium]|nr:cache domain-containing protein [Candidatus Omnitrophota bacterium]